MPTLNAPACRPSPSATAHSAYTTPNTPPAWSTWPPCIRARANWRSEPLFRDALEIDRFQFEREPAAYAHAYAIGLNNLGRLYDAVGDPHRAEELFQQAHGVLDEFTSQSHIDYAATLNNLGWLYANAEDYAQAEPLYQQASP